MHATSSTSSRVDSPYRIDRELQRQPRHSLYLARHVASGRWVLIEVLSRAANADHDWRSQFALEAGVSSQADPERMVSRQLFEVGGRLHAIFDVPPGRPLGECASPLRPSHVIDIGIDLARGLASLHRMRMVHGAVRMDGVNARRDGGRTRAMLLDVGYCVQSGMVPLSSLYTHLPNPPPHPAPELARGAPLETGADVYGLGALMYQLLTGSAWNSAAQSTFPAPTPPELAALVGRCLALHPGHRPSSMTGIADSLAAIRDQPPRPPAPVRRQEPGYGFGKDDPWFVADGVPLTEAQMIGMYGYAPDYDEPARLSPAWLYGGMALLLLPLAAGYFAYLLMGANS